MALIDVMHSEAPLTFLGSSLGAWLAAELADEYGCKAILINPVIGPDVVLPMLGVASETVKLYSEMKLLPTATYFFSEIDEVIDNTAIVKMLQDKCFDVTVVPNSSHRFNGSEFDLVIKYIRNFRGYNGVKN